MRHPILDMSLATSLAVLCACAYPVAPSYQAGPAAPNPPATLGRNFPQSALSGFVLDQTTPEQVQAALGAPLKQTTATGIAKPTSRMIAPGTQISLSLFLYAYAPNGSGQPASEHPIKLAFVQFVDGRLAFYDFVSTLPGEANPPVDRRLLGRLRQGHTTRAQAIALLGPPNSQGMHLLDNLHGFTQIGYAWTGGNETSVDGRTLSLFFDRSGRLSTYTLLDNTYPVNTAPLQLPEPPDAAPPAEPSDRVPAVPEYDLDHT